MIGEWLGLETSIELNQVLGGKQKLPRTIEPLYQPELCLMRIYMTTTILVCIEHIYVLMGWARFILGLARDAIKALKL